jgi:hypothetical protein
MEVAGTSSECPGCCGDTSSRACRHSCSQYLNFLSVFFCKSLSRASTETTLINRHHAALKNVSRMLKALTWFSNSKTTKQDYMYRISQRLFLELCWPVACDFSLGTKRKLNCFVDRVWRKAKEKRNEFYGTVCFCLIRYPLLGTVSKTW